MPSVPSRCHHNDRPEIHRAKCWNARNPERSLFQNKDGATDGTESRETVDSDVRRSKIGRRDTVIGKGLMSCFAVEIARFQVLHKSAEELDVLLGYAYCAEAATDVMAHMRDLRRISKEAQCVCGGGGSIRVIRFYRWVVAVVLMLFAYVWWCIGSGWNVRLHVRMPTFLVRAYEADSRCKLPQ
jgi:hypothetical protein